MTMNEEKPEFRSQNEKIEFRNQDSIHLKDKGFYSGF